MKVMGEEKISSTGKEDSAFQVKFWKTHGCAEMKEMEGPKKDECFCRNSFEGIWQEALSKDESDMMSEVGMSCLPQAGFIKMKALLN